MTHRKLRSIQCITSISGICGAIVENKRLEYHVRFVTMSQMVMASVLQRIFTDLQRYQHNPLRPSGSYDLNLGGAVK